MTQIAELKKFRLMAEYEGAECGRAWEHILSLLGYDGYISKDLEKALHKEIDRVLSLYDLVEEEREIVTSYEVVPK